MISPTHTTRVINPNRATKWKYRIWVNPFTKVSEYSYYAEVAQVNLYWSCYHRMRLHHDGLGNLVVL